jgi:hypothetical protein
MLYTSSYLTVYNEAGAEWEGNAEMKGIALAAAAGLVCFGNAARADDAASSFDKIFRDVCISRFGQPDVIEDWATDQNLAPITNPRALAVFAGKPNKDGKMISVAGGGIPGSGKAWAVPDAAGRFVLATRLDPESCVVWAQKAEAPAVEVAFAKLIEDVSKPGTDVKLADDRTVDIPTGQVHIRTYRVWSGSPLNSLAMTMAVVNHSGGPFQAMLETQRLVTRDDVINPMVPLEPPG